MAGEVSLSSLSAGIFSANIFFFCLFGLLALAGYLGFERLG
jgi:hypothetical protein